MKNLLFVALLVISLQGYGQQTIFDTIIHDGLQRSFILYIPESYSQEVSAPLIINFHGYTSTAFEQMYYGDFRGIADSAGFLLVHPMGTLDNLGNTYWNANWGGTVDDIGFTEALIDSLAAEYNIDTDRVYSTGMSNGGFMSYTLACDLSHRIAAIASVTGTMNINQWNSCTPQHPMPVLEIHGTADGVVPYNGNGFMESIPNTLNYWVNFNVCETNPVITLVPDLNPNDGCTAEHYRYQNGMNGVEVEHYKIINGGHTWPGSPFQSGGGNTNQDFNASVKIWEFFSKYDLNGKIGATRIEAEKSGEPAMSVYPNPTKDFITIEWENVEISHIRILNIFGIEVYDFQVSVGNSATLRADNFKSGIYYLLFYNTQQERIFDRKILIN